MRTRAGQDAAFDRQAHAEGSISELKRHGAGRARCRGTRLLQLQLLAAATAINLKRLISIDPAASQGLSGDPDARNRAILTFVGLFAAALSEIHEILNDERSTGS